MWRGVTKIAVSLLLILIGQHFCLGLHPVILVPGNGGNQIEARVNKPEVVSFWCRRSRDWFTLWLNVEDLVAKTVCFADNIRLVYDNITHTTSNPPGVETRVPGWGNTSSMEFISKSSWGFATYFSPIVEGLVKAGYVRGHTLLGAPYDFRKAANEQGEFFGKLKLLVEEGYEKGGQKVVLVSHSMGSIMLHYFLQQQSSEWKEKHIRCLVSLAGAWAGLARALKVFAVGDNMESWIVRAEDLVGEQRTDPSLAWLVPQKGFWSEDEVLVQTPKKNFTVGNISEFFMAYDEPNFAMMVEDTKGLLQGLPPPEVEVFCLHGSQVPTTEKLVYPEGSFPPKSASWWASGPSLVKGDGDGTVNLRSLQACLKWKGKQKQPVHYKIFPKVKHSDILKLDDPVNYVVSIIKSLNLE